MLYYLHQSVSDTLTKGLKFHFLDEKTWHKGETENKVIEMFIIPSGISMSSLNVIECDFGGHNSLTDNKQ